MVDAMIERIHYTGNSITITRDCKPVYGFKIKDQYDLKEVFSEDCHRGGRVDRFLITQSEYEGDQYGENRRR